MTWHVSAVGIATGYGIDNRGVGIRVPEESIFSSSCRLYRIWGQPSLIYNGDLGVKRPVREADNLPRTSAEDKCESTYPHIRLHAVAIT
jgi:hypothetical protein